MPVSEDLNLYRIYVLKQRRGGSEIVAETKTNTANFDIAKLAFWYLYNQDFNGHHLLLMTCNGKKINIYRYQSQHGDDCYIPADMDLNNE